MDGSRPTIKGVYVKSHVEALRRERGAEALVALRKAFQQPIDFNDGDDVPVRDEVKLLEAIVDIISTRSLDSRERELEAGRLHFRNFTRTPLWNVISPFVSLNLKFVLLQSRRIAELVFRGVKFSSEDAGEKKVVIALVNNDYPIEHFQGFFEAWLEWAKVQGSVLSRARESGAYEYAITWS